VLSIRIKECLENKLKIPKDIKILLLTVFFLYTLSFDRLASNGAIAA
jgi:hypothetical protein